MRQASSVTPEAPTTVAPIALLDLQAQRRRLDGRIERAIARVVEHGQFILGPEVVELERRLARECGSKEAITCASGTDALLLFLLAKGVGPGQAVFVPSFTFASTAEVVVLLGATPYFVDVGSEDFTIDVGSLEEAMDAAASSPLTPAGIIAVDLFGQPADYATIEAVAEARDAWVLADAAQSFGASVGGRRVGTFGDATATSFYPAKPLGCYGDGGAVLTDDPVMAATLRSLRVHGDDDGRPGARIGITGRLDTIQAAVLIEKLSVLEEELETRRMLAARYSEGLSAVVEVPSVRPGVESAWAEYTIRVPARDAVTARLREMGVPSAVYYPEPLHRQPAYRGFPTAPGGLATSERLARQVLSLPLHPYLTPAQQEAVIAAVRAAVEIEGRRDDGASS